MVYTLRVTAHRCLYQRRQAVHCLHGKQFSARPQLLVAQEYEEKKDSFSSPPLPLHLHNRDNDEQRIHPSSKTARHATLNESQPKIGRLILVRHGQSLWNVTDPTRNLTARFTGWADIGLTQQGKDQAVAAAHAIQYAVEKGTLPSKGSNTTFDNDKHKRPPIPAIDVVFCSLLKRSEDTMNIILEEINLAERIDSGTKLFSSNNKKHSTDIDDDIPKYQYPIPIIHSWRLNERHYGALVGLSKDGAERLYGKVRLTRWRDSWDIAPPPMPIDMVKRWGKEDHCQPVTIVKKGVDGRTCVFDPTSTASSSSSVTGMHNKRILEHGGKKKRKSSTPETTATTNIDNDDDELVSSSFMPPSESLRDTYECFLPLWVQGIARHLRAGKTVLVVGHANTIRSMLFAIDGDVVTKDKSKKVKIPSALPLVYEFVDGDIAKSGCLQEEITTARMNGSSSDKESQQQLTNTTYKVNGRECSSIVPGNLRVLKPHHVNSDENNNGEKDLRYLLNGIWVETNETKSVSFCTEVGVQAGEQDIA